MTKDLVQFDELFDPGIKETSREISRWVESLPSLIKTGGPVMEGMIKQRVQAHVRGLIANDDAYKKLIMQSINKPFGLRTDARKYEDDVVMEIAAQGLMDGLDFSKGEFMIYQSSYYVCEAGRYKRVQRMVRSGEIGDFDYGATLGGFTSDKVYAKLHPWVKWTTEGKAMSIGCPGDPVKEYLIPVIKSSKTGQIIDKEPRLVGVALSRILQDFLRLHGLQFTSDAARPHEGQDIPEAVIEKESPTPAQLLKDFDREFSSRANREPSFETFLWAQAKDSDLSVEQLKLRTMRDPHGIRHLKHAYNGWSQPAKPAHGAGAGAPPGNFQETPGETRTTTKPSGDSSEPPASEKTPGKGDHHSPHVAGQPPPSEEEKEALVVLSKTLIGLKGRFEAHCHARKKQIERMSIVAPGRYDELTFKWARYMKSGSIKDPWPFLDRSDEIFTEKDFDDAVDPPAQTKITPPPLPGDPIDGTEARIVLRKCYYPHTSRLGQGLLKTKAEMVFFRNSIKDSIDEILEHPDLSWCIYGRAGTSAADMGFLRHWEERHPGEPFPNKKVTGISWHKFAEKMSERWGVFTSQEILEIPAELWSYEPWLEACAEVGPEDTARLKRARKGELAQYFPPSCRGDAESLFQIVNHKQGILSNKF